MKGKTIVVAGGSGGLGAAVTEELAERGSNLVIGYLSNRARAEELAARLSDRHGVRVALVSGDVREQAVRRRLLDEAAALGDLYGLVPMVGAPARVGIETATEEEILDSMRVNYVGPVLLARDFAAAVKDRDAAVVFISTMQGTATFVGSAVYAAPKAALIHAARILAKQWTIRVNVVAPGVNNAGMAEASIRSGKYDRFIQTGAIPRFGSSRDVARAIAFFLEPDNYITGQVLTVDGGLSLKM